jgi:hypothetical protein
MANIMLDKPCDLIVGPLLAESVHRKRVQGYNAVTKHVGQFAYRVPQRLAPKGLRSVVRICKRDGGQE